MASKEELLDKSFNKITNNHYECIHCGMHLKSSGILRRCAHLAGVKGFSSKPCRDPNGELQQVVVSAAQDVIDMHIKDKQSKAAAQLVRQSVGQDHNAQQPARKQQKLGDAMAKVVATEASAAWGDCFFECNIPFRVADSARFKKAVRLSIAAGAGYTPPGRKQVADKLLTNCYSKYDMKSVSAFDEVKTYGYTSGEDGWTDNNRVPITGSKALV